jgi:hypothetical protein
MVTRPSELHLDSEKELAMASKASSDEPTEIETSLDKSDAPSTSLWM